MSGAPPGTDTVGKSSAEAAAPDGSASGAARAVDVDIVPARMGLNGIVRNLVAYYFGAYIILVAPFSLLVAALLTPLPHVRYRWMHFWISLFIEWFGIVYGIKIEIVGREHVDPTKNYLFVANHRSWLDVVCIVTALKPDFRLIFMIKEGLAKIPVFGSFMTWVGYVTVSRESNAKRQNAKRIETAAEVLKMGQPMLIFPEGTRTPTHRFARFRRGAAEIALRSKTPLMPIVISGTGQLFPRGTPFMRPGPVRLEFLPPVEVDDTSTFESLNDAIFQGISRRYRIEANGPAAGDDPAVYAALTENAAPNENRAEKAG